MEPDEGGVHPRTSGSDSRYSPPAGPDSLGRRGRRSSGFRPPGQSGRSGVGRRQEGIYSRHGSRAHPLSGKRWERDSLGYFVVTYEQGPGWVAGRAMRDQAQWLDHAEHVNSAMRAAHVVIGGPVGDGTIHRAMLVTHFASDEALRRWIESDPWIRSGTLAPPSVEPLNLLVSYDDLDPLLEKMRQRSGST
jgi:hypothetical protein